MTRKSVLVVDDEVSIRKALAKALEREGYLVTVVKCVAEAIAVSKDAGFHLLLCDLQLPDGNGLSLIQQLRHDNHELASIIITGNATVDSAIQATKEGVFHYVTKPFNIDEVLILVRKALKLEELSHENKALKQALHKKYEFDNFIGDSAAMMHVFQTIEKVANSDSTVLITGESGTGKELVARALHYNSSRNDKLFIPVNCGAIPGGLLESELFGHMKGSFTGAVANRMGRFQAADGGTLFLDEIGELPLAIQPKLLRLLQEREYERVGEARPRRANVRVIAATNRPLADEVRAGRFREDLYYRLNVIAVALPGLHERPGDLARLAESYRRFFAVRLGKKLGAFSPAVAAAFAGYRWPGNLRELRNVIERAAILATGETIELHDLPEEFGLKPDPAVAVGARVTLDQLEAEHIRRVLAMCRSLDEAARVLGIDPATLYRKRQKLGLL